MIGGFWMNSYDPRVKRTRQLLTDAMKKLLLEEGYEAITIRDIVKKAEVNRSTFYLHFRDKQDIFEQIQLDVLNELAETLKYPTYTYDSVFTAYKREKKPMKTHVTMLEHIQKHASFYRKMLTEDAFRKQMIVVIKSEVLLFQNNVWEATFMAEGAIGIIRYWLENGMKESIDELSMRLTQVILFPLGDFRLFKGN